MIPKSTEQLAADALRKMTKDLNQAMYDTMVAHHLAVDIDVVEQSSLVGKVPVLHIKMSKAF